MKDLFSFQLEDNAKVEETKPEKITAKLMEIKIAEYFGMKIKKNGKRVIFTNSELFLPNIIMFNSGECDLLFVSHAGFATEVEIKISKYDMINELKKKRYRYINPYNKLKYYYLAFPDYLLPTAIRYFPKHIGLLVYDGIDRKVYNIRKSAIMDNYRLNDKEKYDLAKLMQFRVWKDKIRKQREE